MQISKREKLLLMVMFVAIVSVVYCMFLLPPVLDKVKVLDDENIELENEIAELQRVNSESREIVAKHKILNAKIDALTSNYFHDTEQENIILILDDLLAQSGVVGESIIFDDPDQMKNKIISVNKNMSLSDMEEILAVGSGNKGSIISTKRSVNESTVDFLPTLNVELEFNGTNETFMNLIKRIGEYERKILISQVTVGNSNGFKGKINLKFVAISGAVDEEISKAWSLPITAGNNDPLSNSGMANNYFRKSSADGVTTVGACDYIMTAKPITADLPTVILGIDNAESDESFIYADNEGIENVEFHLFMKNGKYLCKYKTEKNIYPSNSIGEEVPFAISDNGISMRIFSNPRTSLKDKSGVNLKLINETDKPFVVNVINDDPNRPRVKIEKKAGNIFVQ
ncbi:MAG: hypothetical protein PHI90_10535 [Clostridia bacterium]|nr:hypothetical protein [Clostridia bacterium]MDD4049225.1 hypothetical protein [Clostridia bacterium]